MYPKNGKPITRLSNEERTRSMNEKINKYFPDTPLPISEAAKKYGRDVVLPHVIKDQLDIPSDLNVIYLTQYGSHLYGTSTPTSDVDYKGVFLPTPRQILLGKVPKSLSFNTKSSEKGDKNTKGDIDCELYSFNYFIDLAIQGQTVALEMLWACRGSSAYPEWFDPDKHPHYFQPDNVMIFTSAWNYLVGERDMFITKNMKAFLGYAKGQAIRYSLKGDKLNTLERVIGRIESIFNDETLRKKYKLHNIWKSLFDDVKESREDKNIKMLHPDADRIPMVEICGRKLKDTVTVQYALDVLIKAREEYGRRAREAANADGADYKALSHSIRIASELKSFYTDGGITFPMENADHIKDIKAGKYRVKEITEELTALTDEIEILAEQSSYPEGLKRDAHDQRIFDLYKEIVIA